MNYCPLCDLDNFNMTKAHLCKMILSMFFIALLSACGNAKQDEGTPQIRVIGEISTITPSPFPPTQTPTPTPLPSQIPEPTPRSVSVTRIHDLDSSQLLQEGQPVPSVMLTAIDGLDYTLDDYAGQVVIVNFWTLGCGSCFYEFPFLQEAYAAAPDGSLLVLGVNVSDLADETRTLAQTLGIEFPMVVDPQGAVFATHFGGAVVPTTYFIGPDGVVFDVVIGPMSRYMLHQRLTELGIELSLPDNS